MRFSALLAVPIALVGLAVPASAEDPGLTVTWPTATDVNVSTDTYTITVNDTAPEPQGTLYAEWRGERQELPHNGTHAMQFAAGGTGAMKVVRCIEGTCSDTGDWSPSLTVWRNLDLGREQVSFGGRPGDTVKFRLSSVAAEGATLSVAWRLTSSWPEEQEFEAVAEVPLDASGNGFLSIVVPEEAQTATFYLTTDVTTDFAPFGPHRTSGWDTFDVDGTPATLTPRLSSSSIYPHRDGYRDSIGVSVGSSEIVSAKFELVSSSGRVVRTFSRTPASGHSLVINGRTATGALLPSGSYTLRVTGTDAVGNKRIVSRAFSLSHKRIQTRTWTRTFKAGATLTRNGAFVQACSTLRKPSLRGWAGSLGYYSRTKCSRDNADIVSTTNGVYVPKAFQNRYGTYQVSFYGGGARGTRGAYIVMGYLNNKNAFTHRIQGGAPVRSYAGKVASAGNFVHDKTTKPYVLWTAGLTDGSRYDVKSFTVKLTYTVLA